MTVAELDAIYRNYIACLNRRDWNELDQFVAEDVSHNGRRFGLAGYRAMLERDVDAIPDLSFFIRMSITQPPFVAARLDFDCTPKGSFLDLPVEGRRISFSENVFYEFRGTRIADVWSVIDKQAIEAQLSSEA